ncbi:hypothetical protein HMPREF9136_1878 [Prevotella dentalis DSM 3688]|uniref:Uncharacterized protein n=1 Tax=Prevotella dentalis (strain ATCC 49559 / DSM 3688 / JCM 13448 / NCTC 12043 / ES 2772) TaxID=908937 RepID=F9D4V0_PREDD|nr:hypothetical protein HMPREF9136_1878 [Prevotella dentalis DSM 3688]
MLQTDIIYPRIEEIYPCRAIPLFTGLTIYDDLSRKREKYSRHRMANVGKRLSLHVIMAQRAVCQLPMQHKMKRL